MIKANKVIIDEHRTEKANFCQKLCMTIVVAKAMARSAHVSNKRPVANPKYNMTFFME